MISASFFFFFALQFLQFLQFLSPHDLRHKTLKASLRRRRLRERRGLRRALRDRRRLPERRRRLRSLRPQSGWHSGDTWWNSTCSWWNSHNPIQSKQIQTDCQDLPRSADVSSPPLTSEHMFPLDSIRIHSFPFALKSKIKINKIKSSCVAIVLLASWRCDRWLILTEMVCFLSACFPCFDVLHCFTMFYIVLLLVFCNENRQMAERAAFGWNLTPLISFKNSLTSTLQIPRSQKTKAEHPSLVTKANHSRSRLNQIAKTVHKR